MSWKVIIEKWGAPGALVVFICVMLHLQAQRNEVLTDRLLEVVETNTKAYGDIKQALTQNQHHFAKCCGDGH